MRDLSELGMFDPSGDPLPTATPESIAEFEREFQLKLPEDYASFLLFSDGGCPVLDYSRDYSVDRFDGVTGGDAAHGELWSAKRRLSWLLADKDVPIASDGGDGIFFIDCASDPSPVLFISLDDEEVVELAGSFGEFIDLFGPNRQLDDE